MNTNTLFETKNLVMGEPYVETAVVPTLQAQRDYNCARGMPSVQKDGTRDATVAIVGFGPSLAETWPMLVQKKYDAIWTVSKAHDYLVERGVIPTHHTDTDYREHKAKYNSQWQPTTKYRMATQVHPTYLDLLDDYDIALFHVVQPNGGLWDPRYLKQPVTFDSGLQAARLSYELGFRNQSWFGMDASARGEQTHAGPHEGVRPESFECVVAGEKRVMSNFLIRQALFCEKMMQGLPKMRVTIHGDGALRPFLQERRKVTVA